MPIKLITMRTHNGSALAANADDIAAICEDPQFANSATVHLRNGSSFVVGMTRDEIVERLEHGGVKVEII